MRMFGENANITFSIPQNRPSAPNPIFSRKFFRKIGEPSPTAEKVGFVVMAACDVRNVRLNRCTPCAQCQNLHKLRKRLVCKKIIYCAQILFRNCPTGKGFLCEGVHLCLLLSQMT